VSAKASKRRVKTGEPDKNGIADVHRVSHGPQSKSPVTEAPQIVSSDEVDASQHRQALRILEAKLFASDTALTTSQLAEYLHEETDVAATLAALQTEYAGRGVNLVCLGGKWMFRTASDLAHILEQYAVEQRRLSRAALETLAIITYHQPVTRAEIEDVRGVTTSRGTLDVLMQMGWVRPRGRRRAPGRPVTYGTTDEFLQHFDLGSLTDLPGLVELKGAGLLDTALPPDFCVPAPRELAALLPDECPLEEDQAEEDQSQEDVCYELEDVETKVDCDDEDVPSGIPTCVSPAKA